MPLGSLWKDRKAVVVLLPDIRSIRCRDMLLSVALIQVSLVDKCRMYNLLLGARTRNANEPSPGPLCSPRLQTHLQKVGVPLCLIFPVKQINVATMMCRDFSLDSNNGAPAFPAFPPRQSCQCDIVMLDITIGGLTRVLRAVEVYADVSSGYKVYEAFGNNRLSREPRRSASKTVEAWGYYMLRACCGTAIRPMCCLGFGCADTTNYLVRHFRV